MILAQASNPYGNVKEGRIKLLAQVLSVSIWTENATRRTSETKANSAHPGIYRSVYWDESQEHLGTIHEYLIIPMSPVLYQMDSYIGPQYAALIVEPASSADITEEDKEICTYRRIGLLVDSPFQDFFNNFKARGSRYNFRQSEKSPETLILV
jgi:hypothetical protein